MRDFAETFESVRDEEEEECFGEMEFLFGLYEDRVRLCREQHEQSPKDTGDFTDENLGQSLSPLSTPEPPLGEYQGEYESLRLPSETNAENYKPLRDPQYEIFENESPRASAPLHESSCEEHTHSSTHMREEHPHSPKRSTPSAKKTRW